MSARSIAAILRRGLSVRPALTFMGLARWLMVASIAALASTPTLADPTGTTVHGSMTFNGFGANCFGINGCGTNTGSGDTAVIGPGLEFSYLASNGFFAHANFGASTLDITFGAPVPPPPAVPCLCFSVLNGITFTFVDAAFVGGSFTLLSSSDFATPFPGPIVLAAGPPIPRDSSLIFGLVGDTFTVQVPAGLALGTPYSIRFGVVAVPEPSTTVVVLAGLLMIGYAATRRSARARSTLSATA